MVRIFHVFFPERTIIRPIVEGVIAYGSFLVAAFILLGPDASLVLQFENGANKILLVTIETILCSYYFGLYESRPSPTKVEGYSRLLIVLSIVTLSLALLTYRFPQFAVGKHVLTFGAALLTISLLAWRAFYEWIISRPSFREPVYILGGGERAEQVMALIAERPELGLEVMNSPGPEVATRQVYEEETAYCHAHRNRIGRIIVALRDRRGKLPVRELLDLRLSGMAIEDAKDFLEHASGKIEINDLQPSSIIFSDGFCLNRSNFVMQRCASIVMAFAVLLVFLPFLPFIALAIRLSSPGPVLFRQERVGLNGQPFMLYKFRSMRSDAEAISGAVWAGKNDPRTTRVGRFLRLTRLDEVPQLWNVLRGDMGFVGPRPERPEFVKWLSEEIPYYNLRHVIRPGLTGWAQVRYRYGASVEDTKEKLRYDLYYAKHLSLSLDLLIMFETIKVILFQRGSQ